MKWLNDLQVFLSGKKTIIMAVVGGVDYIGAKLGWWGLDDVRTGVEATLYGVFLRMGVTKSGPTDAAPIPTSTPAVVVK